MNRRQRRAEAKSSPKTTDIKSASDIPLSQPPSTTTSKPTRTLLEIAAERQAALQPTTTPFSTTNSTTEILDLSSPSPSSTKPASTEEIQTETPIFDTLFLTTSLSCIHFTLETLTVHQYAQTLHFTPIVLHTLFLAFPTLFLLIHLTHGHLLPSSLREQLASVPEQTQERLYALRQLGFLVVAWVSGCQIIRVTNAEGYYAVMKNASSLGVVWVWCVLEMGVVGAVSGVVVPVGWGLWRGYAMW